MKKRFFYGLFCFLIIGAMLSAGCNSTPGTLPVSTPAQPELVTFYYSPGELRDLVQNASSYAHSVGQAGALAEFSKKAGMFSRDDVYVYAYDNIGTLLAHPYESEKVGENRDNFTDIRGLPVIRIGEYTASMGGGFLRICTLPRPAG